MMDYMSKKFRDKLCHVIGFGRSNRPLVNILVASGARVVIHDKNESIINEDSSISLANAGVKFVLGENYLNDLYGDFIFRSPGVKHREEQIVAAIEGGAVLTSEMELFFEVCKCPIIGITGSDGKTTTTTLTHLFLSRELEKAGGGNAYVGGNIGAPLLPLADKMGEHDYAVVELSSFQLQTMKMSPSRALITNISPNHLDWHTGMDEYTEAKCNIYRYDGCQMLVTNAENPITLAIADNAELPVTYFSSIRKSYADIVPKHKNNCNAIYESDGIIYFDNGKTREGILKISDILLPGRHNVENYMSAIALTYGLVSKETIKDVAISFKGVPHRLELVRELNGVKYYNSSIDSSPTRTAAAIKALPKAPIIICGGYDKQIPFAPLAKTLLDAAKHVILTGATAEKIKAEIDKCGSDSKKNLSVTMEPDFKSAVLTAAGIANNGDIVLLSPACASFDAFKDFEERGNYFKQIINGL